MKYLLIVAFLMSLTKPALADDESIHFAAHFGSSYAIETFSYGFFRSAVQMDRVSAYIFSSFFTGLVGLSYKYMESHGLEGSQFGRSMLYNQLGILGAGLTIFTFKF